MHMWRQWQALLTVGDTQVQRHHREVDDLEGHPHHPQGFEVLPHLRAALVQGVAQGALLHPAFHPIEAGEVAERVAGGEGGGQHRWGTVG